MSYRPATLYLYVYKLASSLKIQNIFYEKTRSKEIIVVPIVASTCLNLPQLATFLNTPARPALPCYDDTH